MIEKFGVDIGQLRETHLGDTYIRFQFTSKRKKMSTILQNITTNEYGHNKRLHTKGAAEIVLGLCSHYINEDGEKIELGEDMRGFLMGIIEEFATKALRTICLAYKDLKDGEGGATHEEEDEDKFNRVVEKNGLTCIGILGIRDIIRIEVPGAVETCQKAGIKVRMVTGDNKITAMAIARECNIVNEESTHEKDSVMEGSVFYERIGGLKCKKCDNISPCACAIKDVVEVVQNKDEFIHLWKILVVLARSRPEDKYLMVTGLKEMGDVVAVTGDGTNDAPALKKADVGFAMGITGTDVAKHAADIILLDDNFASIVRAVLWGRNIYDNIRRFLQFQLTVNVVALVSAFVGACLLRESPLQPIQLLWVNMIMDSLGSLALATEPPKPELLERKPLGRDDYIISRKMVKHIGFMSIYQSIIIFGIVFAGEFFIKEEDGYIPNQDGYIFPGRLYDWDNSELYRFYVKDKGSSRHFTIVFNAFVLMQIFNMLNARKINDELNIFIGITDNKMFLGIFFIILIV